MEDSLPLRVALVGMGRIGRAHLRALSATPAAEVRGVYDQNLALARERDDTEGVRRVYSSWREVLDDEHGQCVGVLLPHDLHEQYSIEALEAGKHVVCEKPLAPTLAECDRMLAAATRSVESCSPCTTGSTVSASRKWAKSCGTAASAKCSSPRRLASRRRRPSRPGWPPRAEEGAC